MEELYQWLEQQTSQLETSNWLFDVSVVLTITVVAFVAWRMLASRLERLAAGTRYRWDEAVWFALWKPINWLIAVVGLSLVATVFAKQLDPDVAQLIPISRKIAVVMMLTWAALRFIRKAEQVLVKEQHRDQTTVLAVGKLLRASVVILMLLAVMQILGFSISGVLAFGGMGGLIVGMAAKDLLSNFFGALIIYLDKPFKVGDWVRSPDRSIEGTVENIGWRVTRIRTFDKRPLYIPNAIFSSIVVENPSRMSHRRIKETIGIRYGDAAKMQVIVEQVKQMLEQHPEIDTTQTLMVNFDAFGPSSLDFFIYTFTKTTNWVKYHQVKQDVLNKIVAIVEGHGAEFAFPTRTLHVVAEGAEQSLNSPLSSVGE
ncbi:mechanosensitive ion channel family protein [Aliagarivorans marinus]|uniref:mechanosensitive ion channel family protein n=1 Tax=Aliagarivorans marinus TaxID=561965 RepID=UPI000416BCEA|nr:mechanosensitive ion channel family protein [Aliagarivorans marinus]